METEGHRMGLATEKNLWNIEERARDRDGQRGKESERQQQGKGCGVGRQTAGMGEKDTG